MEGKLYALLILFENINIYHSIIHLALSNCNHVKMRHLAERYKVLKTQKIGEAELAAQRARITKVGRNMIHHTTYYLIIIV
jgi:hypothetical protein